MRHYLVAATLAAMPAVCLAASPHPDAFGRQRYNDYYYRSYDTAFEPICVNKQVRTTDERGKPVVKKVRVCR